MAEVAQNDGGEKKKGAQKKIDHPRGLYTYG